MNCAISEKLYTNLFNKTCYSVALFFTVSKKEKKGLASGGINGGGSGLYISTAEWNIGGELTHQKPAGDPLKLA